MAELVKFVIITYPAGRTNFIQDVLSLHPNVLVEGAILDQRVVTERRSEFDVNVDLPDYLETEIWGKTSPGLDIMAKGFTIHYPSFRSAWTGVMMDYLQNEGIRAVHFHYANPVNMIASKIAKTARKGSVRYKMMGGTNAVAGRLSVGADTIANTLSRCQKRDSLVSQFFNQDNLLDVTVEDAVADPNKVLERLEDFLALPTPTIPLDAVASNLPTLEKVEERILNYGNLAEQFASTKYKSFFAST